MRLFKYILLCLLLPSLNASNFLSIKEGEIFKSSAAPSVYLYCTSVSPLQESSKGGKYEF